MRHNITIILLIITLAIAPASAFAMQESSDDTLPQQEGTAFVLTFANLRLRSLPTLNAPTLQTIPSGTTVRATGRDAGLSWLYVEYRGVTGWVSALYVRTSDNLTVLPVRDGTDPTQDPPPPASQTTAIDGTRIGTGTLVIFSNDGNVNIRSDPNVDSPRLSQIPAGTRVDVMLLDPTYSWGQVEYDGVTGWVALWVVNTLGDIRTVEVVGNPGSGSDLPLPNAGAGSVYSEEQRAVVQTAQNHLGRYVPNASVLIEVLSNGANNGFISCGPVIPYFRLYRPSDFDLARVPELETVRDNINSAFDSLNRARAQWLIACRGGTLLFRDQYPAWLAIAQGGLPALDAARSLVAELSAR
jgi:uncharacterized protein YraI